MELMSTTLDLTQLIYLIVIITPIMLYYFRNERTVDKRLALLEQRFNHIFENEIKRMNDALMKVEERLEELRNEITALRSRRRGGGQ
jgi:hypothetical protein